MRNVNIINIRQHRGFTLMESLLTLFILTVGILGVAGLQMHAMSSGGIAMQRTIVLIKTQELLERMRINQASIVSYDGAGMGADGSCNAGVVCTGATMAAHDLWMWRNDLLTLLPTLGATPIVVVPGAGTAPATITLTVNWTAKTNQQASATQAQSYVVQVNI